MAKVSLARRRTAELTPEQLLVMAGRHKLLNEMIGALGITRDGLPRARAFRAKYGRQFTLRVVQKPKAGPSVKLVLSRLPIALLEDLPA